MWLEQECDNYNKLQKKKLMDKISELEKERNNLALTYSIMDDKITALEAENEKLQDEKNRRIYYQNIVYAVCLSIEKALGMNGKIVVGTIENPSAELQDKADELLKKVSIQEAEIDNLRACIKREKLKDWSTDATQAWQLVEELKDYFFTLIWHDNSKKWECHFAKDQLHMAWGNTAPEAICLAYLQVKTSDTQEH